MNLEKALVMLGLSSDFTKEDLRKAYKDLARKYHPDYYENKPDCLKELVNKKMQEINAAKEYLAGYTGDVLVNFEALELEKYKKELIDCLTLYTNGEVIQDMEHIHNSIMIKVLKFEFLIENMNNKEEIYKFSLRLLKVINSMYKTIQRNFYKRNFINEEDVEIALDYDCSLADFYKQLCTIRDNYGGKVIFDKNIEEVINKYSLYENFGTLKKFIDKIIDNARDQALKSEYNNVSRLVFSVNKEILDVFQNYNDLIKRINAANEFVSNSVLAIDSISKEDFYLLLKNHEILMVEFNKFESLSLIEELLLELEKLILDCKRKEENVKRKNVLENKYQSIINKASLALQKLSVIGDNSAITHIMYIEQAAFRALQNVQTGYLEFDSLDLLDKLTFTNLNEDNEVLMELENRTISIPLINIYMKRESAMINRGDTNAMFNLENHDGKTFMRKISSSNSEPLVQVNQKILERDYISLHELLQRMVARLCPGVDQIFQNVAVLHSYGNYVIYLSNGDIKIGCGEISKDFHVSEFNTEELDKYKDKGYLEYSIIKQVEKTLIEREKKNKARVRSMN